MNQGVEILLARMDSNPEEFVGDEAHKWGWVVNGLYDRVLEENAKALPYLNDEEVEALWGKFNVIRRDSFTHRVMETLLEESEVNPFADAVMQGFGAAPIKAEGAPVQYDRKIKLSRTQMEMIKTIGYGETQ